jgi:hypothetical protein
MGTRKHPVVPANAGTRNPWPQWVTQDVCNNADTIVRAVWVPAFAGTT